MGRGMLQQIHFSQIVLKLEAIRLIILLEANLGRVSIHSVNSEQG